MTFAWCDQTDGLAAMFLDEPHGFREVAVVGNNDGAVVSVKPSVVQQMHGEIDVGTLLLGLDDLYESLPFCWFGERRANTVSKEMAKMDFELGNMVPQGPEIDILSLGLRGIVGRGCYPRREVLDALDPVMALQDSPEESHQVEPFSRSSLQRTIVKIEPIDVDVGSHSSSSKSKGLRRGPAPCGRNHKGCI